MSLVPTALDRAVDDALRDGAEYAAKLCARISELEAERASLQADLESAGLMIVQMDKNKVAIAIQPGVGVAKLREAFKL